MRGPRPLTLLLLLMIACERDAWLHPPERQTAVAQQGLLPDLASTAAVGTLPSEFDVDGSGQLHFRLPIEVPPGRNGMQPELTFTYLSTQTESSLGVGFAVSGVSAITRCAQTLVKDLTQRRVEMNQYDAFCLDGERLIPTPTSPVGGHGSEYRLERDSLRRIWSWRDTSSGISGVTVFYVQLPDGRLQVYGKDPNAQQTLVHTSPITGLDYPTAFAWLLRETRDASGNTITYRYQHTPPAVPAGVEEPHPIDHVVPESIEYTGYFDGTTTTPGNRRVVFTYLDAPDGAGVLTTPNPNTKRGWYQGHYKLGADARRLSRVRTEIDGVAVREYRIRGSQEPRSGRWRVDAIQGCANAPARTPQELIEGMVCMPAHEFSWRALPVSSPEPTFKDYSVPILNRKKTWSGLCADGASSCVERNPVLVLDMNGDGADDLVYQVNNTTPEDARSRLAVRFGRYSSRNSAGDLTSPPYATETVTTVTRQFPYNSKGYGTVDWDFDGLDDVLFVGHDGQTTVLRSTGANFSVLESGLPRFNTADVPGEAWQFSHNVNVDINGDGLTDLLACQWDLIDRWTDRIHTPGGERHPLDRRASWHYALRTATGFGPVVDSHIVTNCTLEKTENLYYTTWLTSPGEIAGDFDGDGVTELLIAPDFWGEDAPTPDCLSDGGPCSTNHHYRVMQWRPNPWVPGTGDLITLDTNVSSVDHLQHGFAVDLNGDGLHDVAGVNPLPNADAVYGDARRHYNRVLSAGLPGRFVNHTPSSGSSLTFATTNTTDFPHAIVRHGSLGGPGTGTRSTMYPLPFDLDGDGRGDLLEQTLSNEELLPIESGFDVWQWGDSRLRSVFTRDGMTSSRLTTSAWVRGPRTTGGAPGTEFYSPITVPADADGDGALDLLELVDVSTHFALDNPPLIVHHNVRAAPLLLARITNGLGAVQTVSYEPLSNSAVYTRGGNCAYPVRCVSDSRYVVSELTRDDGIGVGTARRFTYSYRDGRADVRGRGWLGFSQRTVTEPATGALTVTTYDNRTFDPVLRAYPLAGKVLTETVTETTPATALTPSLRARATRTVFEYEVRPGTVPLTY
ncbi:MAG: hypothetical protein JNK82_23295, partial [Myxococcaceae bacterium]|nr:hypothetical protein [Myxococcaceae bacterium]